MMFQLMYDGHVLFQLTWGAFWALLYAFGCVTIGEMTFATMTQTTKEYFINTSRFWRVVALSVCTVLWVCVWWFVVLLGVLMVCLSNKNKV